MSKRYGRSRRPRESQRVLLLSLGLVFAAASASTGDISASEPSEERVMTEVVLGAADSGKQIRLAAGNLLILRLLAFLSRNR